MTIRKPGPTSPRVPRRAGILRPSFTLVELLVVISIISVLMVMTVRVTGAFITQARVSATETTIRKIQGLLSQRADALYRLEQRTGYLATTVEYSQAATIMQTNLPAASPYRFHLPLREILTRKLLTRKYFPQTVDELNMLNYPSLYPNLYAAALWPPSVGISISTLPDNFPNTFDNNGDTGAISNPQILYAFLTQSGVIGNRPAGTDSFSSAELQTVTPPGANQGLTQFIDAWGNPLRFYRWPTALFRTPGLNGANPDGMNLIVPTNAKTLLSMLPSYSGSLLLDLARDPDDPLRFSVYAFPSPTFETLGFHTPATYHTFLVVSAGPDGKLGLYEPEDTANNGHLAAVFDPIALTDDITYLNTRAGGR